MMWFYLPGKVPQSSMSECLVYVASEASEHIPAMCLDNTADFDRSTK